jgi:hypothetical protein
MEAVTRGGDGEVLKKITAASSTQMTAISDATFHRENLPFG